LLLEIISGKRNNGFHQTGNFDNLLGHVSRWSSCSPMYYNSVFYIFQIIKKMDRRIL
jgi:hypothetical protein